MGVDFVCVKRKEQEIREETEREWVGCIVLYHVLSSSIIIIHHLTGLEKGILCLS